MPQPFCMKLSPEYEFKLEWIASFLNLNLGSDTSWDDSWVLGQFVVSLQKFILKLLPPFSHLKHKQPIEPFPYGFIELFTGTSCLAFLSEHQLGKSATPLPPQVSFSPYSYNKKFPAICILVSTFQINLKSCLAFNWDASVWERISVFAVLSVPVYEDHICLYLGILLCHSVKFLISERSWISFIIYIFLRCWGINCTFKNLLVASMWFLCIDFFIQRLFSY